jgi:hypothetical protein
VGYTDRRINAMSVNKEHIRLLTTCADIYKAQSADQTIAEARSYVLDTIYSEVHARKILDADRGYF